MFRKAVRGAVLVLAGWVSVAGFPGRSSGAGLDPFEANRRLGCGVNLGNALEAPREGDWGMRLESSYFSLIKDAGFQSVRIPVRWSAHAGERAPYLVETQFMARVEWAVRQALAQKLTCVLNIHHYNEFDADPASQRERFLALWDQIAARFKAYPASLYFELYNEPHDKLTPEIWNGCLVEAIRRIRASNPDRILVVGPGGWSGASQLDSLRLPDSERRVIVTFHNYEPFHFTHQGASWVAGSEAWLGTRWEGTEGERKAVTDLLDRAARWAQTHRRPLYMGEYGAYSKADMESRVRWTRFVRSEAERRGFSTAYWEFGAQFGLYDRDAKGWRKTLLDAVVGKAAVQ